MDKERKYKKLRKEAQELHIPLPEASWDFEVTDKNGKVIKRYKQRSHSWVRNIYNMLFSVLGAVNANDAAFGAGKLNIKDLAGAVWSGTYPIMGHYGYNYFTTNFGYLANPGQDTFSILVGSGTNAEDFEDYQLQTQIVHGVADGELDHAGTTPYDISYDAPTKTMKVLWIRYFDNAGAVTVEVNEVALAIFGYVKNLAKYWVQSRDKLATGITVPAAGQLRVTYTISLVYPA